jgi:hypothetical protein
VVIASFFVHLFYFGFVFHRRHLDLLSSPPEFHPGTFAHPNVLPLTSPDFATTRLHSIVPLNSAPPRECNERNPPPTYSLACFPHAHLLSKSLSCVLSPLPTLLRTTSPLHTLSLMTFSTLPIPPPSHTPPKFTLPNEIKQFLSLPPIS